MALEKHTHKLKKGLFVQNITFLTETKMIKGKKYLFHSGGYPTKKGAQEWMKQLKKAREIYRKRGVLIVAKDENHWAVWQLGE